MDFVTKAFAPKILLSPIVILSRIVTLGPIKLLLPIIGPTFSLEYPFAPNVLSLTQVNPELKKLFSPITVPEARDDCCIILVPFPIRQSAAWRFRAKTRRTCTQGREIWRFYRAIIPAAA